LTPPQKRSPGRRPKDPDDRGAQALSVDDRHKSGQPSGSPEGSKPTAGALAAGLYVVATPIGNLGDIGDRARRTLEGAALVACEDTRMTGQLLRHLGLRAQALLPYHDHNAAEMRPRLLARLAAGEAVALVSDAGTPLISDPGFKLVRAAREAGHAVWAVPGASALLSALVVAGLPTDRFLFAGFLPAKDKARRAALDEIREVPATLVFYDSARRLAETLAAMADVLGRREAAVCRELTKLHEEVRRDRLPDLAAAYAAEGPPRGEVVIVVGPPEVAAGGGANDVDALLRAVLKTQSVRDAAATVAAATGLKKTEVYARALDLAREAEE
jgi:16S rRNA (cytidine1402-2'-O)-methyltransferase